MTDDELIARLPETLNLTINGEHTSSTYTVYRPVIKDGVFKGYRLIFRSRDKQESVKCL